MQPPMPSLTSTWHNAPYQDISPTRPELSATGKTVVVTGGGKGIGAATAKAFAKAGASHVALLGRTIATLDETKNIIEAEIKGVKVSVHVVDVADESEVKEAAKAIGTWHVLVINAGVNHTASIADTKVSEWWRVLETNLKGSFVTANAFLPTRNRDSSTVPSSAIIGISAGIVTQPPGRAPNTSAYNVSKMGQLKFLELLAAETPDCQVLSVHPGIVKTDITSVFPLHGVPLDDIKLPAHFNVWAASKEAEFARGKMLFCNWDVPQLKAKAEQIEKTPILVSTTGGWPYHP